MSHPSQDGRPHPAVTRILQHAADIASSRNGQQMSAKSLHRRLNHEFLIALRRRRAAIARAVLPNPSARAERLFAGIIDRALHHWGHVSPLCGGPCDHDHADSETDTATPFNDDDIPLSPVVRSSPCSHHVSNNLVRTRVGEGAFGRRWLSQTTTRTSSFVAKCRPTIFTSRKSLTTTRFLGAGEGYLSALSLGAAGSLSIAEAH